MTTLQYTELVPSQLATAFGWVVAALAITLIVGFFIVQLTNIFRATQDNSFPDPTPRHIVYLAPICFMLGLALIAFPFTSSSATTVQRTAGVSFLQADMTVATSTDREDGYSTITNSKGEEYVYLGPKPSPGDTITVIGTAVDSDIESDQDEILPVPVLLPNTQDNITGSLEDAGQTWYAMVQDSIAQDKTNVEFLGQ